MKLSTERLSLKNQPKFVLIQRAIYKKTKTLKKRTDSDEVIVLFSICYMLKYLSTNSLKKGSQDNDIL